MDRSDLAARIDHAVWGPTTTPDDARRVVDAALSERMNARVPPCYLAEVADYAPSVTLATAVGFPHGQHATDAKREEATLAWDDGADELDVVPNHGRLRAGGDDAVRRDVEEVIAAVPIPVGVMVEPGPLSPGEKRRAVETAAEAGAASVTIATGTADAGATVEDVAAASEHLPVTAAGTIDSWERARRLLEAGAGRIATPHGVAVLDGFDAAQA